MVGRFLRGCHQRSFPSVYLHTIPAAGPGTFTIRKGVKFQDGTEITAEDVLWSMQHTMGPQAQDYAVASVSLSKNMERVEQTGPDRVSMTTLAPSSALAADIAEAGGSWAGVVFPKRGTTLHNEKENDAYHRNPIGAGIMRMVKLVPAEVMTFERFDDYYHQPKNGFATDKRVKFAELDLLLVPEVATRVAALRAGDADIAPVGLDSRKQVEAGGGRVVLGQEGVAFEIRWLGCFQPQFPCHDKRVRQALNYAIDKVTMQNELYGGPEVFQIKGFGVVTPSTIGYSPELDPYPFDPDKARQLLADAGYPGGEGFGKLVINTWTSPSTPLMPESAQLAAENWKRELGLEVELRIGEEAGVKKASKLSTELYGQLLWRDNETRIDRADTFQSSYGLPPSKKKDTRHNDPELFALARETLAVFDPVERVTALNSAYQRLREEAYEIPLGYFNIPWGIGPRIQTWEPYPLAFYPSALHTITLK